MLGRSRSWSGAAHSRPAYYSSSYSDRAGQHWLGTTACRGWSRRQQHTGTTACAHWQATVVPTSTGKLMNILTHIDMQGYFLGILIVITKSVSCHHSHSKTWNWVLSASTFSRGLLRGAWTDHCFPAPFSWFLHETGLECLKITSPPCFSLKCQRKDSKKVKEHRQFCSVIGRWRTAAIDRTTCHACQRCRKTAVFAVFPRLWGVIWRGKAFGDQQC